MEARNLTQKFIDDVLGYFIEPKNKICTSLLLGCGLPGGMMGSMMADLKGLKDMAGIGRPAMLGKLTRCIKEKYPHLVVQYHGHTGPGLSMASVLEVCRNGADIIDVAMEPLSWGMVHPDVISVQAMLREAGFDVPDINMSA